MRKTLKQLISQFLFDDLKLACIENGNWNTAGSTAWRVSLNEQGTPEHPEPLYAQAQDNMHYTDAVASSKLMSAMDRAFSKGTCGVARLDEDNFYISTVTTVMPATLYHVNFLRLDSPEILQCIAEKKKGIICKWSWEWQDDLNVGHAALIVIDVQKKLVHFWDPANKATEDLYEKLKEMWGNSNNAFFLPGFRYNAFDQTHAKDMQGLLQTRPNNEPGSRLQFEFESKGICNVACIMVMHLCYKFGIYDPFEIEKALIRALNIDANSNCAYKATKVFFGYCHLVREFGFMTTDISFYLRPAHIAAFLNPKKRTEGTDTFCAGKTKAGQNCSRPCCRSDNYCWQHRAALYALQENNKKCTNPYLSA